jgi:hypothetical protein
MADVPMNADGMRVQNGPDPRVIRLVFESDTDGTRTVDLDRIALPQLLGALQHEIGAGSVVPIRAGSLQLGADYRMGGHGFRPLPNGGLEVTFHMELIREQRVVSLPLELLPEEVAQLKAALNRLP